MLSIKNKIEHHLLDYEKVQASFSWEEIAQELGGLPDGKGLNIAHEAITRHSQTHLKDTVALRFIQKDRSFHDFTYSELQKQTSKFANVLENLGIQKGERVFSLMGRIPELYITALGTLKYTAVFCPLFSVFGPEPIFQRANRGDACVLITTSLLFEKKVKQLMERLPSLRYHHYLAMPLNIFRIRCCRFPNLWNKPKRISKFQKQIPKIQLYSILPAELPECQKAFYMSTMPYLRII